MGGKTLTDKEYLNSEIWKCVDSPTNAHHWIELQNEENFHTGLFYCKWCHDVKRFPKDWYGIFNKED